MHPIGIDLGTTFSAIVKWVNKTNFVGCISYQIPIENSDNLPSKIYIEDDDNDLSFTIGKVAQDRGVIRPDQYIYDVKRKMDDADFRYGPIFNREFSPVDISAEIVKHLLKQPEQVESPTKYLPLGIVVTVPYYFKHHQNLNTKNAALKALKDLYSKRTEHPDELFLGLVAEPIAAGLDFAFNQANENLNEENFLVFDLGGGTFDLTIFSLKQNNKSIEFQVRAIDGDDRLGGEDFDESLFLWLCDEHNLDFNSLSEKDKNRALKRVRPEVTRTKINLSSAPRANITVANVIGTEHLDEEIRRAQFEDCLIGKSGLKRNYVDEIAGMLDRVLLKAGMSASKITSVLLTGGSSQIPCIRELISSKFGDAKVRNIENVRLAVARGAAIYAAYLLDKKLIEKGEGRKHLDRWEKIEITEPTAHNLGIPTSRVPFFTILPENTITPATRVRTFHPTQLSDDGAKALWPKIEVLQGNKNNYSVIGHIDIEDIYTHGRKKEQIIIKITFIATTTLVKINIFVPKGRQDGSDILIEEDLSFEKS